MSTRIRSLASAASLVLFCAFAGTLHSCETLTKRSGLEGLPESASPVILLQKGESCFPAGVQRIHPDGTREDLSSLGTAGLAAPREREGTWIYFGQTPAGTVKTIVVEGVSTTLPEEDFGADLEIRPETHPLDIRPSSESLDSDARFSFTVLFQGKPSMEPVRYSASRLGRAMNPEKGTPWKETDRETIMGKGRVYVDEPGIWWITAELPSPEGAPLITSLTFYVPAEPGHDNFAAFTNQGEYLDSLDRIVAHLADAEVIFLGEQHNDPVAHWLEKEIFAALHRAEGQVALSLEMFERDVQAILDGYLKGIYKERHFLDASRPWPRYAADYRPMVEYARTNNLPVIAANAPRRIVNLVSRQGSEILETLPEEEKRWLPPLDYHVPTSGPYVDKLRATFEGFARQEDGSELPGPRLKRDWKERGCPALADYNEMLLQADSEDQKQPSGVPHDMMMRAQMSKGFPSQSLWDAAMGHSIARFLEKNPQTTVLQVNGAFHSDEHLGTVEQLLRYRPDTKVAVISMVPHQAFPAFDADNLAGLADIIIVTDPSWQPEEE
ncbi:MAG: ChaN family lipoprotein [Planctomycetota bacterium]